MRRYILLAAALIGMVSCSEKHPEQDKPADVRKVKIVFGLPETKVAISADRTAFEWESADEVAIFNDASTDANRFRVLGGEDVAEVPLAANTLYGLYPYASAGSGPSSVTVSIPESQTQSSGGVFPSHNYPLAAKGVISGGSATLQFKPLASALAFNIYGGTGSVQAVRVTPLSGSHFAGTAVLDLTQDDVALSSAQGTSASVTVTLGTPVPMGTKPSNADEKRTFPGQIYLCMARQQYGQLLIEVDNGSSTYKLTTSPGFTFDCAAKDIIISNLNLEKGTVEVEGVGGETFDATGAFEKVEGSFAALTFDEELQDNVDRIPDFSRVGYKYGDEPIPSLSVVRTISVSAIATAISNGQAADTTDYIQKAIDAVGQSGGGAILFKNGTYNVSRILFLDYNNVVIRGESQSGTIIKNNSTKQAPIVYMGKSVAKLSSDQESETLTIIAGRRVGITTITAMGNTGSSSFGSVIIKTYSPKIPAKTYGVGTPITETYVPLGRLSIEVMNPGLFSPGDKVCIYRPATAEWLADIGMDRIASNGREAVNSPTQQWTESGYTMRWTRVITAIKGNRVYLDAPVAQSIDSRYGGGHIEKYTQERISGSGVENISFDSSYDSSVIYNNHEVDECHAWQAVLVRAAEHCWIRNVTTRHMGYALADMGNSARCITVENCTSLCPVSAIQGARRYAYCCSAGSELCLVKNCTCDEDRHSFVTNGTALGPNVFTGCTSTNGYEAIGPHWGYATATLYDCIQADTNFEAQDGGNQGTGHGWRGVNTVFWNVTTTAQIVSQNLWATCTECGTQWNQTSVCRNCGGLALPSARNYSIGCIGQRIAHSVYWNKDYYGNDTEDFFVTMYGYDSNGENRPVGEWYPTVALNANGTTHVSLPEDAGVSWWPQFSTSSFSNPLSLYQCQLEDRHARGIYLNTL